MSKHMYALVRCVPDPHTSEFVNIGAIAGDPATGEWSVRQVANEGHARKLASQLVINAAHDFLGRAAAEADAALMAVEDGDGEPLGEQWLLALHHDHRNIVQLSTPLPMVAADAEAALDTIFAHMIVDPVKAERGVTKSRVLSYMRSSYKLLAPGWVHYRPGLFVGAHVSTPVDFGVANGSALQLTQCWSFQNTGGHDRISTDVKAWAYALARVRDGHGSARLVTKNTSRSTVDSTVDLQVVVARPETDAQRGAFEEAEQIFADLEVQVHGLEDAATVADRAKFLIDARDTATLSNTARVTIT